MKTSPTTRHRPQYVDSRPVDEQTRLSETIGASTRRIQGKLGNLRGLLKQRSLTDENTRSILEYHVRLSETDLIPELAAMNLAINEIKASKVKISEVRANTLREVVKSLQPIITEAYKIHTFLDNTNLEVSEFFKGGLERQLKRSRDLLEEIIPTQKTRGRVNEEDLAKKGTAPAELHTPNTAPSRQSLVELRLSKLKAITEAGLKDLKEEAMFSTKTHPRALTVEELSKIKDPIKRVVLETLLPQVATFSPKSEKLTSFRFAEAQNLANRILNELNELTETLGIAKAQQGTLNTIGNILDQVDYLLLHILQGSSIEYPLAESAQIIVDDKGQVMLIRSSDQRSIELTVPEEVLKGSTLLDNQANPQALYQASRKLLNDTLEQAWRPINNLTGNITKRRAQLEKHRQTTTRLPEAAVHGKTDKTQTPENDVKRLWTALKTGRHNSVYKQLNKFIRTAKKSGVKLAHSILDTLNKIRSQFETTVQGERFKPKIISNAITIGLLHEAEAQIHKVITGLKTYITKRGVQSVLDNRFVKSLRDQAI